ncbi:unnamed protein product (macronuclear) [Paramecium tetraurelia]|uniref:Cation-transporting P-type ATPase N-terminal domain-containing protein n=1 Tax=Paramecium tetraurelia TaxID=5888 RepID=A0D3P7_PARTE|nr:uncharacterized protein GSPATT00013152001 [Paramecium tetraurelia]CAK77664.1 unnamed protein product [Paramecium tetraurelia]|eukprot:XP_001445061.1 hypothetical protein (macronuclear) [Paramecium tetraurelia strain d4-2]
MSNNFNRSSSEIIIAYVEQYQELQLLDAQREISKLEEEIIERRKRLLTNADNHGIKANIEKNTNVSTLLNMDEHYISFEELEKKLQTSIQRGLNSDQIEEKQKQFGKNRVTQKQKSPWYIQLLHEMTNVFSLLLWGAATLCFLAYGLSPEDPSQLYLGIVLVGVIVIITLLTYFQNRKSEAIMAGFSNFIPPEAVVIRDGQQLKIPAIELVPGDVVIIDLGKKIPADIRIIESNQMKVDNSCLTGESIAIIRTIECTHKENPLETKNLAFFGTLCKEGNGKGVVISIGDKTVIGQIAGLVSNAIVEETPLKKELNQFTIYIARIAMTIGILFFVLGFSVGYPVIQNLIFAIGIISAIVPEGLLATVVVALAITAKKLASLKVLVKNLEGVETLGSTSCICSDKTGTLTQNKMTVENLWYNRKQVKGANKERFGASYNYEYQTGEQCFDLLHETAILCSEATFDTSLPQNISMKIMNDVGLSQVQKEIKLEEAKIKWQNNYQRLSCQEKPTIGDASETALIIFFQPIHDILQTRSNYQVAEGKDNQLARKPFNSTNKYAIVIIEQDLDDSYYCLLTKGAPERVWKMCNRIYNQGKIEEINEDWDHQFKEINNKFGNQGERVLGFCRLDLPKSEYPKGYSFNMDNYNFPFEQQIFIGLISLIDPLKESVPLAVQKCKSANIQVIMVTGDQPVTAAAIAKQCNIITEKTVNEIMEEKQMTMEDAFHLSNALVIHGDLLTKMALDDEGLPESEKGKSLQKWLSKPQLVFARTSPAQKLIIVTACQKRGHIVAVTGDGVNDSPAIKKADIGIAMGITGSDVAQDAADMILLNDDFSNIVVGIQEGRRIFDNFKKVIAYALTANTAELIPFLAFIIFRLPLPLTTILVLCVQIGTDIFPSMVFVFEDADLDIMTRRPRNSNEHLVSSQLIIYAYAQNGVLETCCGFFQWYVCFNDFGFTPQSLLFLLNKEGVIPKYNDIYDPSDPWFGNSNLRDLYPNKICEGTQLKGSQEIDWIYAKHGAYDLRMTLLKCENGQIVSSIEWGSCNIEMISPVTNRPYCYHTEASNYAQTSFFFGVVLGQICNYQSLRQLKNSFIYNGFNNIHMYLAYFLELLITLCLSYIEVFNAGFGTRDVLFIHYGICGLPFGILIIIWNEGRKYLIRYFKSKSSYPSWWERCVTY